MLKTGLLLTYPNIRKATKMKIFLWNYCDYHAGFNPLRFKLAAYVLHLIGSDYWYNSLDYRS